MRGVSIEERAINLAHYIIDTGDTVRGTAKKFGVSKSTVHTVDGRYYISVPTKDGYCMIYSTADWNLESRDNHIFQWIKATRDISTKSISENPEEEMSNIGGKLMQHDATAYEIGYNLPKDLGLEYDAIEIGKYLERVARRGTKEAAESAISGEQSKEEKYYGGE